MNSLDFIRGYLEVSLEAQSSLDQTEVAGLIDLLNEARAGNQNVFVIGNGGSAAAASHLAAELGKEASWGKEKRFRVMSLADNIPWMTSIANDADYSQIFVEQLINYARRGDLLIAFSASGNSRNVLRAVEWANRNELLSVGVTGTPGGELKKSAQRVIQVPHSHIGHIQEGHFLIQHLLAYYFIEQH